MTSNPPTAPGTAPGGTVAPDAATLALLPDAVLVVDATGRVVAANDLAARLLEVGASDLVGAHAATACPLRDEAAADWWTCARPLEGDPTLTPRIPEHDLALRTATGRTRPVTVTAARTAGPDGRVAAVAVSLRRADRRARLDAARSDLVSTVSHELRSPLTSVKGFTKTLLAKWDRFTDEQKQQMLRTVNEDADRVTRLLGELLDVSRIDAGRLQLRRQMVDVPGIVERVLAHLGPAVPDRTVSAAFDEAVPRLYADPDKVEQVFTNLVENAVEHGAGNVVVRAAVRSDHVEFVVSDEGEGIPEAQRVHVFTKFFRAGARPSGTGLGLYITKGIVEAHGGRIWATGRDGTGAAFHATFPRGGLELAGIAVDRPARAARRGKERV